MSGTITRRGFLAGTAATLAANNAWFAFANADDRSAAIEPKPVAAVITVYFPNSHADVLLTKILEGWRHDGGPGPALTLASLYVEQTPESDMARALCEKHGVPIFDSIEEAVTVGSNGIPVEGVISIGEHGDYPWNNLEQHLYPRRRLFSEITDTFEKYGRVVPVFNDKHLGPQWEDAQWMYERAREMHIPFMAGSSLPVGFRDPDVTVPMNSAIESAVGVGYSGLDIYGFHTLDCYQSLVERRAGSEQGVRWVQALRGEAIWQAVDDGAVSQETLNAALSAVPRVEGRDLRDDDEAVLFLFEYVDGFQGAVFMLNTILGIGAAVNLQDASPPMATYFEERPEPRHPHFAFLLKGIERMVHTGRPSYPIERTYLAGGILDRALTSLSRGSEKLMTPELEIAYEPVDYPYAQHIDLLSPPR